MLGDGRRHHGHRGADPPAVNTMYAAIATRGREIAVLRAIGFYGDPVVFVLLETMLLAAVGVMGVVQFCMALPPQRWGSYSLSR